MEYSAHLSEGHVPAAQNAVLPGLRELYDTGFTVHMCNGGKWSKDDGVSAGKIASWIPADGGSCTCDGSTCMDARVKLGFPNVPLVDYMKHELRKEEAKKAISWGVRRSTFVAQKVAE